MTPLIEGLVRGGVPGINSKYNVNEILEQGGVDLKKISSCIWSHWHIDHIGDVQQFPKSTEVVVGPGFKKIISSRIPNQQRLSCIRRRL
jgi:metal-dependent hydrolase (beta-lactamase superfamily II)